MGDRGTEGWVTGKPRDRGTEGWVTGRQRDTATGRRKNGGTERTGILGVRGTERQGEG